MSETSRVLVLHLEGADWDVIHGLLDAGKMPALEAVVSQGVMGELATLRPQLAPMLWTSLATGMRGHRHGVLGYLRAVDNGVAPVTPNESRCKTLWRIASDAGTPTCVVNCPSYPAEPLNGSFVSQLFTRLTPDDANWRYDALPRLVHPAGRATELSEYRINPAEFSLDDLRAFVPEAALVAQDRDPSLAVIASWLAEWTASHAIATHLLERGDWRLAVVHYDAIDRFGHAFMRCHPPRPPGTPHEMFRLYKHVMTGVYAYADMMLGRLVELAGSDATVMVVSSHGFRSGRNRPASAGSARGDVVWHRPLGMLAMKGPGIRCDEWIWGGSVLDVCPTALALLGLPVADDMCGRPLTTAFAAPPNIEQTPSWESSEDDAASAEPLSEQEAETLLQQLVDDGYLRLDQVTGDNAAANATNVRDFNLAQVHLERGDVQSAARLLERLLERRPRVGRWLLQLARCRYSMGDLAGCRELAGRAAESDIPAAHTELLLSDVALREGNRDEALGRLFSLEQVNPRCPGVHLQIGRVYLQTERWADAALAFKKELAIDGDSVDAHLGLGRVHQELGEHEHAVDCLLAVLSRVRWRPDAHFQLGTSLAELGKLDEAAAALRQCLSQQPNYPGAAELLAAVCKRRRS